MKRILYAVLVGSTLIVGLGNLLLWKDNEFRRDQSIAGKATLDKLQERTTALEMQQQQIIQAIQQIGSLAHRHVETNDTRNP